MAQNAGLPVTLAELLPRLRCPASGASLQARGDELITADGRHVYEVAHGVPQLRRAPDRLKLDLPWFDPWQELEAMTFAPPEPMPAEDLPYHLDPYLASVPGRDGAGRWILEIGCGERRCEPYFTRRGFRYVGTDVDRRGVGPHVAADAHNLPFEDGSFDLCFSLAVYEHLMNPLQAAREAFRVLKPGGTFFGTAAFVYGFHDRASFHHMTHAGLHWNFRMAGFRDLQMWPDWEYTRAIPEMAFGLGRAGAPWRVATRLWLSAMDSSFVFVSQLARRLAGRKRLDVAARAVHQASSITFRATKPLEPGTHTEGLAVRRSP